MSAKATPVPVNGRYQKGNPGGPGRPRGSMDFVNICKKQAKEKNVDLEKLLFSVAIAMFTAAGKGNVRAAELVLDRFCGKLALPDPATVAAQVNINTGDQPPTPMPGSGIGPTLPTGGDLTEYLDKLRDIAANQGLVSVQVHDDDEDGGGHDPLGLLE